MPTPNPTLRREYKGAAAATTLQNSMTNADTSFVLVTANNWPTGAVGKFVVCINRGQADEEKILCDTQTSKTVACQLANRGFDGTTAQGHAAGATVECTISAFDADEWNQHTNATSGVHGVTGPVVGTTDTQPLSNKTITASTFGGVSDTALGNAWTAFTPTFTNLTLGNGTVAATYKQIGKTVSFRVAISIGSTTTGNGSTISFTLPVAGVNQEQWVVAKAFNNTNNFAGVGFIPSGTATAQAFFPASTTATNVTPWNGNLIGAALASGMSVIVCGTYEAA